MINRTPDYLQVYFSVTDSTLPEPLHLIIPTIAGFCQLLLHQTVYALTVLGYSSVFSHYFMMAQCLLGLKRNTLTADPAHRIAA
jgi:hypothetical protein